MAGRSDYKKKAVVEDRYIGKIPDPITGELRDQYASDVVTDIQQKFKDIQEERRPLEMMWVLIDNFKNGNQYVEINPYSGTVIEGFRMFDYEEREIFNQIAPIYETRYAYLNRMKPLLSVRAATNDRIDISKAEIVKSILRGSLRRMDFSKKMGTAIAWAELCGTAFYKVLWEANKGAIINDEGDGEETREGEPNCSVVSGFEVYPASLYIQDVQDQPWMFHATAMHVSEIFETYGLRVEGQDVDVYSVETSAVSSGGIGAANYSTSVKVAKRRDHAMVIEYYERPTRHFKKGRLIVLAGDHLAVYIEKLPYRCGEDGGYAYPFVKQVCIENPGKFYGTSILERILPLQRRYNAIRNRMAEYLNRIAIGVWIAEEGTVINIDQIESEGVYPGSIIFYSRAANRTPQLLQNESMPPEMSNEDVKLIDDFYRVSGVSELARESGAPTGIGSGIALDILKEQDTTRLSLTSEGMRQSIIDVGKKILRLYKEFAVGERISRYIGESQGVVGTVVWTADDITTDDVYFDTESELSDTPAQRVQKIIDAMQYGLFSDPQTNQQIADQFKPMLIKALDIGLDADAVLQDSIADNQRAERENILLEKGVMPKRNIFDDDMIHYKAHRQWRLSSEFEALEEEHPDWVQAFDEHILLHDRIIKEAQQVAAMQQQMMQMAATTPQKSASPPQAISAGSKGEQSGGLQIPQ